MSDELLAKIIDKYRRLWEARRPKLGRWFYCKYCYRNICPKVGPDYSIIICPRCGAGLAPMDDVCRAGSLEAWYEGIVEDFHRATDPTFLN